MKVYGISVSYYTGKLEAYLRYKGIPYEMTHPYADRKRIRELAGAIQVPMIERVDGRWMSDSTPMLLALEAEFGGASILPADPVVRFIAFLIEDYADEWLWRPAMHYRWSYEHDRALLSRILADELGQHVKVPRFLKLRRIAARQRGSFVVRDGVNAATRAHVEGAYLNALDCLSTMLANRRYLLGDSPSLADFGMMGPMLRHFGQDPTPSEIMRNRAPLVYSWVARMWSTRSTGQANFLAAITEDTAALLKEIAETHLVQLRENASAYASGAKHFGMQVQGCAYSNLPVSRYRVHCLEQLRYRFAALTDAEAERLKHLLPYPEAAVLWQDDPIAESGYDIEKAAPYNKAINVYEGGAP